MSSTRSFAPPVEMSRIVQRRVAKLSDIATNACLSTRRRVARDLRPKSLFFERMDISTSDKQMRVASKRCGYEQFDIFLLCQPAACNHSVADAAARSQTPPWTLSADES